MDIASADMRLPLGWRELRLLAESNMTLSLSLVVATP
jgi:hypothetical protein